MGVRRVWDQKERYRPTQAGVTPPHRDGIRDKGVQEPRSLASWMPQISFGTLRAIAVPDKEKEVPSHARSWLGDTSAEEWLRLDPRLSDVDLGPYFHFCRERVAGRAPVAGLLSQEGQQVLNSILGPSRMARQRGLHRFPELVESDKTGIVEAMRQRIRTVPEKTDDINLLIDLAGADPAQVPTLVQTLVELPHSSVPTGAPTRLAGLTGTAPQFASQIESLLQDWEGSQDKRLSTAARRRGQPRKSS